VTADPAATDADDLLVVSAAVGSSGVTDLRIRGGAIVEMGSNLSRRRDRVIDARACAVIPGLHDHHVHVFALAAALRSVPCGPPAVRSLDALASALSAASDGRPPGSWIRGTAYHDSVAGTLDRDLLDALVPNHPVRIQHRSGRLWMLNSAAAITVGLDRDPPSGAERDDYGRPTGRLYRSDHWLGHRVHDAAVDLGAVGRMLSSFGVTGITDATPGLSSATLAALERAHLAGDLPQRLLVLGVAEGSLVVPAGPFKLVVEEAEGIDVDALAGHIAAIHAQRRAVAIHCVTRAEIVSAVSALERAGTIHGDRLEHASELGDDVVKMVRRLGVTVVTQPNFIAERGDVYVAQNAPEELPSLYRAASLLGAGVPLAAGTDAPFGSADPWAAVRAAVERTTAAGTVVGPLERLSPSAALGLFAGSLADPGGPPRVLRVGAPADLCVLDAPIGVVIADPSADRVRMTVIDGKVTHERE
jgi:predicted amidohydrolase YtcJ